MLCAAAALMHFVVLSGAQLTTVQVQNVSIGLTESQSPTGEKFTIGSKLTKMVITCVATTLNNVTLTPSNFVWTKFGSNVSISDSRLPISSGTGYGVVQSTLTISHPVKADFTSYTCTVNGSISATGSFVTIPLLTISVNGVNEYDSAHWPGEDVTLKCQVNGYQTGSTLWYNSMVPSFTTNTSSLVISSIRYDADRGYYTCFSTNSQGNNSATVFLRVKNPQSYIAPLVSICIEMVLMMIIVVAYELYDKRRRRISDGDPKSE